MRQGATTISTVIDGPAATDTAAGPAGSSRGLDLLRWNPLVLGGTVAVFAALVWNRRWISDDGLIVLRTVRQLVAGEGPVFNVGERVEASTSTLWTALLALPGLVPGVSLNRAAVVVGLLCSVAGLALALDAARRLFGSPRMLPFGALVVVALPPFWDFGTSGLETGLILGWLGLAWWLLVRRLQAMRDDAGGGGWPLALVVGLAPLVRPDLALVALCLAVAVIVVERRLGWPRLVGLGGVAVAVPAVYEVFRAGYYGLLVPSTALAKEASSPRWAQGGHYLDDFVGTYQLLVPLAVLAVGALTLATAAPRGRGPVTPRRWATTVVVTAPVVAGLLLALYVTRVGGDFMHARMLLPALSCLLLPVMAVPLGRAVAPAVVVLAAWSAVCLVGLRPDYDDELGPNFIANERMYYVSILGVAHPVTVADFADHPVAPEGVAAVTAAPPGTLALRSSGWTLLSEAPGTPSTIVWLNLGVTGELAPLDVRVLDAVGLVNPLAAHTTSLPDGRIGHDKDLPSAWTIADAGVVTDSPSVAAARSALACPRTREVLESVRAPLTAGRFWANLTGAWERTSYRYPRDPQAAADCRTG